MSIYSCGIILILLFDARSHVMQPDGMVGVVVLIVPTLVYGELILHAILGGAEVSTLGGASSLTLCSSDVCTTLGSEPGLFKRD